MAACIRNILGSSGRTLLPAALSRQPRQLSCIIVPRFQIHTSLQARANFDPEKARDREKREKAFTTYNDVVYPPTKEGEEPRPAEICHVKKEIPGSAKKFWPCAVLVRGLSIDEALYQCEFSKKAFTKIMKEVILEAQEKAVKEFNVEYKSNLWIADSFVTKGSPMQSARRTRSGNIRSLKIYFCHYFVRLREGPPPKHYYPPEPTGQEKLEEYIRDQRLRRIKHSL